MLIELPPGPKFVNLEDLEEGQVFVIENLCYIVAEILRDDDEEVESMSVLQLHQSGLLHEVWKAPFTDINVEVVEIEKIVLRR
jgi:hypothetical protein